MADDQADVEADLTAAAGVLWAQAKDEIAQQVSELDMLRTRAVALLSVAALVGGLFGSRLPHGHQPALRVAALVTALVLFSAGVLLAVIIALPRRGWETGVDLTDLTQRVEAGTTSLGEVNISLAAQGAASWDANSAKLERLYRPFAALCVLTGLQVVAWALAVF
jgi:hypothetical protein